MDSFDQRKQEVLEKIDKSSKGSWDVPILALCEKLNLMRDYYTTSSCSGRAVLMKDQEKKAEGLFYWVSHDKFSFEEFFGEFQKIPLISDVKFKQDPPILHVACRTLKSAQDLYNKAKIVGWKRSGLISFDKRIILELNSTEKLEFPVIRGGEGIVNLEFLGEVVKDSNLKLKKSWDKIDKLVQIL